MTQILGLVTRQRVFHISDRLLSARTLRGVESCDPNSSKAVIFRATDAHVVVSYTGKAYLDGIPTDTFIAQSLAGRPLSNGAFVHIPLGPTWTDIGRAVERLRQDLHNAFMRLSPAQRQLNFEVSILGWQQRRTRNRRVAPIIWDLCWTTKGAGGEFSLTRGQRWWAWHRAYTVTAIPTLDDTSIIEWMRAELHEHAHKSPDEIKRVLVGALHRCSAKNPSTVGQACLLISLTPGGVTQAQIRYYVDSGRPLEPTPENIAYAPWVIAPPLACAPALIRSASGAGGWNSNGYSWTIEGMEPVGGRIQVFQGSQQRPVDPYP
jgi:hypothetical protein